MVIRNLSCVVLFSGLSACGGEGDELPVPLRPLPETPTFGVVLTDYFSTSIALLDEDGAVLHDRWVTSRTTASGLVATLSGDVVLAGGSGPDGALTLVDRFNTDAITRIAMPRGEVLGQLRVQRDLGYSANPQDVVIVSPERAFVSRYEPNLDPSEPAEAGTDLLGFDPQTMTRTGERVDLSGFDATVDGRRVPARPNRIARRGDRLVVGLTRLSLDFQTAAPGQVAVVDLDGGVEGVALPAGLENCGRVRPVPETERRVLVGCLGRLRDQRPGAGLVELVVGADGVRVDRVWRPRDGPDRPIAVVAAEPVGPGQAVAVAYGDLDQGIGDVAYAVDLVSGDWSVLTDSTRAFELGPPAFDPETGRLLIPDAGEGIEVWRVEAGAFARERSPIRFDPRLDLPPRSVTLLR